MEDKGRGDIGEIAKVTGMAPGAPTTDSLGKRYGAFGGWGMEQLEKWRYCSWLVG